MLLKHLHTQDNNNNTVLYMFLLPLIQPMKSLDQMFRHIWGQTGSPVRLLYVYEQNRRNRRIFTQIWGKYWELSMWRKLHFTRPSNNFFSLCVTQFISKSFFPISCGLTTRPLPILLQSLISFVQRDQLRLWAQIDKTSEFIFLISNFFYLKTAPWWQQSSQFVSGYKFDPGRSGVEICSGGRVRLTPQ